MGKNDAFEYDVVWPRGKTTSGGQKLAKRLDTLNGKVVAELWDWVFKGDIMCEAFEKRLKELYPDVTFISWKEFGEITARMSAKCSQTFRTSSNNLG